MASSMDDEEQRTVGLPGGAAHELLKEHLPGIALSDDLQRLIRRKVESGRFPSQEAVIEKALRLFLIEESADEHRQASLATEVQTERLPGPFIEDQMVVAPGDLPRTGREIDCLYLRDATRDPALFPGD